MEIISQFEKVLFKNVLILPALIVSILLNSIHNNQVDASPFISSSYDKCITRTNGLVCYSVQDTALDWSIAESFCTSQGMTMLEILTADENVAVFNLLSQNNMLDTWLGANQQNGTWRWLDGTELSFQGCFDDNSQNHDLEIVAYFPNDNSYETCLSFCSNLSYAYLSLENGTSCWCGNSFGKYGQDNAQCVINCPGLQLENCGGPSSMEVFAVNGLYSDWLQGQPNNFEGYETCATMNAAVNYQWEDILCSSSYNALCELPMANCSSKAFVVNGRCIMATQSPANYFQSRFSCYGYGGDLVMHLTSEDISQIAQHFGPNQTQQYYIGLMKYPWTWSGDSSEFLYTNWNVGQPTGPNLNCITMKQGSTTSGQWTTEDCSAGHLFMCQISNATVAVTVPGYTNAPTTTPRRTIPTRATTPSSSSKTGSTPNASDTKQQSSANVIAIIIGCAVGGAVLLIIILVVIFIVCRKKNESRKEATKSSQLSVAVPMPEEPSYYFGIETPSDADAYKTKLDTDETMGNEFDAPPPSDEKNNLHESNGDQVKPDLIPMKIEMLNE